MAESRVHFRAEALVARGRWSRSALRRGQLRLRHMDWFGPYEFMSWYRTPWKRSR